MAVVEQLLCSENDGTISFGNHVLEEKAKLEDFNHGGDIYKVKTFKAMTKLEKNGMFLYESVPGTSVNHFQETEKGIEFFVQGDDEAQIIVGLEDNTEYEVFINNESVGIMNTGVSGKLNVSVDFTDANRVHIKIVK
jgi:hypothetical protein